MPSETYKEKLIEYTDKELSIDGKMIHVEVDQSGKYNSDKFPYSSFDSMLDLAKAIIDNM